MSYEGSFLAFKGQQRRSAASEKQTLLANDCPAASTCLTADKEM